MLRSRITAIAALAVVATVPFPALAHHPMGGAAPSTAWEGMVSGIAHPVIGLDHLAFLVAAGVLAAAMPHRGGVLALVAFLGAGFGGALLHLAGVGIGPVEAVVALSVLVAGATLASSSARTPPTTLGMLALGFAAAGLFHGHAYAEAVIGSGAMPKVAYLLTLAVMQAGIALAVMAGVRHVEAGGSNIERQRRWVGLATGFVGALALAVAIVA